MTASKIAGLALVAFMLAAGAVGASPHDARRISALAPSLSDELARNVQRQHAMAVIFYCRLLAATGDRVAGCPRAMGKP